MSWNIGPYQPYLVVIEDPSPMSFISILFSLLELDKKDSSACRGWFSFAHVNWCTILDKQMNQTQIKYNFKSELSRFKSSRTYILLSHESERIFNYHSLLFGEDLKLPFIVVLCDLPVFT